MKIAMILMNLLFTEAICFVRGNAERKAEVKYEAEGGEGKGWGDRVSCQDTNLLQKSGVGRQSQLLGHKFALKI